MPKSSTEKETMSPELLHEEIYKFVTDFKLEDVKYYMLNGYFIVTGKTTAALPDHLKMISGVFSHSPDSNVLLKYGDFSLDEEEVKKKIREYDLLGDSLLVLTSTLNQSILSIPYNAVRCFLNADTNDISSVNHWPLD